jgi:hypothetical protein
MYESVILLVASLHVEATEGVKLRAALLTSTSQLILNLGYINYEPE